MKKIGMVALGLILSGCGVSKDKYAALEDQVRICQSDLADANSAKHGCESQLSAAQETKQDLEKKTQTYEDLVNSLEGEIKAGKVKISEMNDRLTVNLIDKILFDSGQAVVKEEGRGALTKVAEVLKGVKDKRVQVEGHTDDQALGPNLQKRFPTNWELSTARATAVVRLLAEMGVLESKLSATGYSKFQPVASNDSDAGRSQNRRIEIVLVPDLKVAAQPAKKADEMAQPPADGGKK